MAAASPLPHFFQHLSREISDNSIGTGVSTGGVGAPAGGIVPTVAPAGGVGAPLAGSFAAVAVVDEDFRSWLFV